MDQARFNEFVARYEQMNEWQIARIQSQESDLTEEAKAALAQVIASRSIDPQRLRENSAAEDEQRAQKQQIQEEISRKREAKIFKILMIATAPIIAVAALMNPARAAETMVSTVVQALGFVLIAFGILKIKRYFSRNK
ncbi:DUF308 domain-containing protein [Stutzerimonas xanthomarina]|nr:DUF308 domain-containing protein [Stutzerimonas xanthomarina]